MSKTTLQGVLTILGGFVAFVLLGLKSGNFMDPIAISSLLASFTAGLGLIHAADSTP